MNVIDRRIQELYQYNPERTSPKDLQSFWEETLKETAARPCHMVKTNIKTPMREVDAYSVRYEGFDGTPLAAWLLLPSGGGNKKNPCMVIFHGYPGRKGLPESYAHWLLAGYAVFAVDIRGQGGESGNLLPQDGGMSKGWITQNITDPHRCYYKAIVSDAIRAVECAGAQPEIDSSRIGVCGDSQGGGLALMTSALSPTPHLVIANIPNMCFLDYGVFHSTGSLSEVAEYISQWPERYEQVLTALSYFDNLHLADRIRIPALLSVGLKDTVCLPETVFAVYNRITSPKQLEVFPFNGHSTGTLHLRTMLKFAQAHTPE